MKPEMIYLDNNATTQPLPEVVDAMVPVLREGYANPSSMHQFGQLARYKIEQAREQVANLIEARPKDIVFTSCGTESINLAIRGLMKMNPDRRRFVTTTVEHSAVMRVAKHLQSEGYEVDYVNVDHDGRIDEAQWGEKLTDQTALVSIMHANNETGVIFDVPKLAGIAADRGIPVHVDAVQSAGKLPINVSDWPVQLMSMSAHKFHGPKGTGALYMRRRTRLSPLIFGGSQERNLRGGTENVAGIVGMGAAAEAAKRDRSKVCPQVAAMRDALESGILAAFPNARVNGGACERICNTTNISLEGLEAEAILILLSEAGICASSGSACSSGSLEASHVLKAMDVDERMSRGAIRLSLSRLNTREEIGRVVQVLPGLLKRLSAMSTS